MYKQVRKKCGLSIEEAAFRLHIAPRTLCKYEAGETIPTPETALGMSKEYKKPFITQLYCKEVCAIGKAFSYEVLNNVNLSIEGVIMSLQQELEEAIVSFPTLVKLSRNKRSKDDFEEDEWDEFVKALHDLLDLEHNIECLKITLNNFTDVSRLIQEHNEKCIRKHYVIKKCCK